MAHRDDHDAALARADALQAELDRERAAHADRGDRIAQLEKELQEARVRLERAEETLGDIRPRRRVDADRVPAGRRAPDDASLRMGFAVAGSLAAIGMLVAVVHCTRSDRGEARLDGPTALTPPFVVDQLYREGIARVRSDLVLDGVRFDYVAADGTLDPQHGRIVIETRRPPRAQPPDDPSRPTGAPAPTDSDVVDMVGNCPVRAWSPHVGWSEEMGTCVTFGRAPVGQPRCTPASIVGQARGDGAPDGLARIRVEWSIFVGEKGLENGWKWTFEITDRARRVDFRREYDDGACTPPPVEK